MAAAVTIGALATGMAQPAPRRYAITSAGALGDGRSSNTRAIQDFIDKTSREGGGTLVVPAGTFVTGALFFKQGVNLSIEKGGVLKGRSIRRIIRRCRPAGRAPNASGPRRC